MKLPLQLNPVTSEIEDADRYVLGVIYLQDDATLVGAYLGACAALVSALREIAAVYYSNDAAGAAEEMRNLAKAAPAKVEKP